MQSLLSELGHEIREAVRVSSFFIRAPPVALFCGLGGFMLVFSLLSSFAVARWMPKPSGIVLEASCPELVTAIARHNDGLLGRFVPLEIIDANEGPASYATVIEVPIEGLTAPEWRIVPPPGDEVTATLAMELLRSARRARVFTEKERLAVAGHLVDPDIESFAQVLENIQRMLQLYIGLLCGAAFIIPVFLTLWRPRLDPSLFGVPQRSLWVLRLMVAGWLMVVSIGIGVGIMGPAGVLVRTIDPGKILALCGLSTCLGFALVSLGGRCGGRLAGAYALTAVVLYFVPGGVFVPGLGLPGLISAWDASLFTWHLAAVLGTLGIAYSQVPR